MEVKYLSVPGDHPYRRNVSLNAFRAVIHGATRAQLDMHTLLFKGISNHQIYRDDHTHLFSSMKHVDQYLSNERYLQHAIETYYTTLWVILGDMPPSDIRTYLSDSVKDDARSDDTITSIQRRLDQLGDDQSKSLWYTLTTVIGSGAISFGVWVSGLVTSGAVSVASGAVSVAAGTAHTALQIAPELIVDAPSVAAIQIIGDSAASVVADITLEWGRQNAMDDSEWVRYMQEEHGFTSKEGLRDLFRDRKTTAARGSDEYFAQIDEADEAFDRVWRPLQRDVHVSDESILDGIARARPDQDWSIFDDDALAARAETL